MGRAILVCLAALMVCCGGDREGLSPTASSPVSAGSAGLGLVDGPVALLALSPSPESTVVVEACQGSCTGALALSVGVTLEQALPAAASVLFELLDEDGRRCAFNFSRSALLVPAKQSVFESLGTWSVTGCTLPFRTATLRATLIGDQMGRPDYAQGNFRVPYRFVEPQPDSRVPTRPEVLSLTWDAEGPTGGECPLPGESAWVSCRVKDDDGDALTVTLSLENLGPGEIYGPAQEQAFGPSPYEHDVRARFVLHSASNVRATCRVVDAHGQAASRALSIPCG